MSTKSYLELRTEIESLNKESLICYIQEKEQFDNINFAINLVTSAIIQNKINPSFNNIAGQKILLHSALLNKIQIQHQFRRVTTERTTCWVYVKLIVQHYNCNNIEELLKII